MKFSLGSRWGAVVLLEVGAWQRHCANPIKLGLTVLLEASPDHLGGQARVKIAQILPLRSKVADLELVQIVLGRNGERMVVELLGELVSWLITSTIYLTSGLANLVLQLRTARL